MNNQEEKTLEHIIRRMGTDRSVDAPADAIKYAKNLYRSRISEPKPSLIRRIVAVLQADLAPDRAAFGERSATGGQARQMLFESGENAVDLRITAVDNGFDVRGQVFGDGFEGAEIELADDEHSFPARLDELSSFKLAAVPSGVYSLSVKGSDSEIFIESLTIS